MFVFDLKCEGMTDKKEIGKNRRSTYTIVKNGKKTTVARQPEKTKKKLKYDSKLPLMLTIVVMISGLLILFKIFQTCPNFDFIQTGIFVTIFVLLYIILSVIVD